MNTETSIFDNLIQKPFWDCKELATYVGISESLVRKLIAREDIDYHKVGRRIVFDRKYVLDEWLPRRKMKGA